MPLWGVPFRQKECKPLSFLQSKLKAYGEEHLPSPFRNNFKRGVTFLRLKGFCVGVRDQKRPNTRVQRFKCSFIVLPWGHHCIWFSELNSLFPRQTSKQASKHIWNIEFSCLNYLDETLNCSNLPNLLLPPRTWNMFTICVQGFTDVERYSWPNYNRIHVFENMAQMELYGIASALSIPIGFSKQFMTKPHDMPAQPKKRQKKLRRRRLLFLIFIEPFFLYNPVGRASAIPMEEKRASPTLQWIWYISKTVLILCNITIIM